MLAAVNSLFTTRQVVLIIKENVVHFWHCCCCVNLQGLKTIITTLGRVDKSKALMYLNIKPIIRNTFEYLIGHNVLQVWISHYHYKYMRLNNFTSHIMQCHIGHVIDKVALCGNAIVIRRSNLTTSVIRLWFYFGCLFICIQLNRNNSRFTPDIKAYISPEAGLQLITTN